MRTDAFSNGAGRFAEQGEFDIPTAARIELQTAPDGGVLTVPFSDVAAISNSGAVLATPLGVNNGPGFGWKDISVVRAAAIYRANQRLTPRGGVSYATDFIDDNEVLLDVLPRPRSVGAPRPSTATCSTTDGS